MVSFLSIFKKDLQFAKRNNLLRLMVRISKDYHQNSKKGEEKIEKRH
jgi:hypothetical protein